MKRSEPLRRSSPEQVNAWRRRSKRVKPRSAKRIAEDKIWAEVKAAAFRRDNWSCQALIRAHGEAAYQSFIDKKAWSRFSALGLEPCEGELDPHHIWPTGEGGPRLALDNVIILCRCHHDWAHANREQATTIGLMSRGRS